MRTFPIFWVHCAPKLSTPPRRIPSFVGAVSFFRAKLSAWARGERVVYCLVWSVVSLSRVSFAERIPFGVERERLCALCSWVSASMLLGVRRGAPLEVHQFEKVGHLRRSGSVKCPLSCAPPTGARGVCTIDSLRRSTHLFRYYCCPENFKTAEKYTPKPFSIGLRAFFLKKLTPKIK